MKTVYHILTSPALELLVLVPIPQEFEQSDHADH